MKLAGCPSTKIDIGLAFYGRGWASSNGGAVKGRYESGIEDYWELMALPNKQILHNSKKDQVILKNKDNGNIWTMDDVTTIKTKV